MISAYDDDDDENPFFHREKQDTSVQDTVVHSVKGSDLYGQSRATSVLCQADTLEPINTTIDTVEYVSEVTNTAKFNRDWFIDCFPTLDSDMVYISQRFRKCLVTRCLSGVSLLP